MTAAWPHPPGVYISLWMLTATRRGNWGSENKWSHHGHTACGRARTRIQISCFLLAQNCYYCTISCCQNGLQPAGTSQAVIRARTKPPSDLCPLSTVASVLPPACLVNVWCSNISCLASIYRWANKVSKIPSLPSASLQSSRNAEWTGSCSVIWLTPI